MPEDAASDLAEAMDQNTPDAPEASGPEDTGTPAAESNDSTPADVDWQERYTNLQPEYTRATQEAAQYRQIIELARQGNPEALELLGLEVEGDEDDTDDDYDDPDTQLRSELDQIKSHLQEQANAEAQAELERLESEYLDQQLTDLAKKEGVEFSDEESNAIAALADRLRDEDGDPDVSRAYDLLTKAAEARQQRYLKSKKADQVAVGTAGTEKVNLADDDARANLLANMLEAGEQAA